MNKLTMVKMALAIALSVISIYVPISFAGDVTVQNGKMTMENLEAISEQLSLVTYGDFGTDWLTYWTQDVGTWVLDQDGDDYYVKGTHNGVISQVLSGLQGGTYYKVTMKYCNNNSTTSYPWITLGSAQGVLPSSTQITTNSVYIKTPNPCPNLVLSIKAYTGMLGWVKMYDVKVQKVSDVVLGKLDVLTMLRFNSLESTGAIPTNGIYSVSVGSNTQVTGAGNIAGGYNNTLYGNFNFATGRYNDVSGNSSSAFGESSDITGSYCTVMGHYAIATADDATAIGSYCTNNQTKSFAVGYGTSGNPKVDFRVSSGLTDISGILKLEPQAAAPAGSLGCLYVNQNGKLYFHNGTDWKEVLLAP